MTLSAYFMSKSVSDQQGCRALTFTLARLFVTWQLPWTDQLLKQQTIILQVGACIYLHFIMGDSGTHDPPTWPIQNCWPIWLTGPLTLCHLYKKSVNHEELNTKHIETSPSMINTCNDVMCYYVKDDKNMTQIRVTHMTCGAVNYYHFRIHNT